MGGEVWEGKGGEGSNRVAAHTVFLALPNKTKCCPHLHGPPKGGGARGPLRPPRNLALALGSQPITIKQAEVPSSSELEPMAVDTCFSVQFSRALTGSLNSESSRAVEFGRWNAGRDAIAQVSAVACALPLRRAPYRTKPSLSMHTFSA